MLIRYITQIPKFQQPAFRKVEFKTDCAESSAKTERLPDTNVVLVNQKNHLQVTSDLEQFVYSVRDRGTAEEVTLVILISINYLRIYHRNVNGI